MTELTTDGGRLRQPAPEQQVALDLVALTNRQLVGPASSVRGEAQQATAPSRPSILTTAINNIQDRIWQPTTAGQLAVRDELTGYITGAARTACLFARGNAALAATGLVFGLDQARPDDSPLTRSLDFGLGSVKGILMHYIFSRPGLQNMSAPTRGVLLGVGSRTADTMLTRDTYMNQAGGLDLNAAANRFINQTFDRRALTCDVAVMMMGEGLLRFTTRGRSIASSPAWRTALAGGCFGLSSGGAQEWMRQAEAGDQRDYWSIARHAILHGTFDLFAARGAAAYNREPLRSQYSQQTERVPRRPRPLLEEQTPQHDDPTRPPSSADIIPRPADDLPALRGLLGEPTIVLESVSRPIPEGEPIPTGYSEFRRALPTSEELMHVYRPPGLPEIALLRDYDLALNPIRTLREQSRRAVRPGDEQGLALRERARQALASEPLADALLPEELVPILAQMPSRLVRRVNLSPQPNPNNPYYAQEFGLPGCRSMAEAQPNNELNFFQARRGLLDFTAQSPLKQRSLHEYLHLLLWQAEHWSPVFREVARMEPESNRGGSPNQAAQRYLGSVEEMWTRNGADMLHSDAATALRTVRAFPMRCSIIARALNEHLQAVPSQERGQYHQQYLDRLRLIEQTAAPLLPRGFDSLVTRLNSTP